MTSHFRSDRAEPSSLLQSFGQIDIYLFDQLLRGNLRPGMRVLDAGCGSGRNLTYLLREGFTVFAIDRREEAIEAVRELASELAPELPTTNFQATDLRRIPFEDAAFDAVLANAVLHFADDPAAFRDSVDELWRVLRPGGLFFARLASNIGIEDRLEPLGAGHFRLPDGSDRFLVDEADLLAHTERLGGKLVDPIKTTNVQGLRCMTTWVARKT